MKQYLFYGAAALFFIGLDTCSDKKSNDSSNTSLKVNATVSNEKSIP